MRRAIYSEINAGVHLSRDRTVTGNAAPMGASTPDSVLCFIAFLDEVLVESEKK
jgi:hypothetical protein